ncbi:hypothetical protein acdb102_31350 [Acidothermaceae bacterium B102]|nr:hypothetical protein acdb102_31350 [Acidothermaceae bacterium B102]
MKMRTRWAALLIAVSVTVGGSQGVAALVASPAHAAVKVILPSKALTPGAIIPAASKTVICVAGYTKKVRNVPMSRRLGVFASYGIPYSQHSHYELDHLISLELGGSNAASNLWPEPLLGATGARIKDKIENKLHALVCDGKISLKIAQHAIATNWYKAYLKYRNVAAPRPVTTTQPPAAIPPVGVPTTPPPTTTPPTTVPPVTAPPTTAPPAVDLCGAPANPIGYNFCGGTPVTSPNPSVCSYFPCIASFWSGSGYMAECADGNYSMSGGLQGACSRHGGELRPVDV